MEGTIIIGVQFILVSRLLTGGETDWQLSVQSHSDYQFSECHHMTVVNAIVSCTARSQSLKDRSRIPLLLGMRLASVQPHNRGALGDKPEEVGR